MKILILTDYYPPDKLGGVGEIAKNLKEQYEMLGLKTWVLTTGPSKSKSRVIRSSRSLILGVFINNIKVIKLIKEKEIDVINMHQSTTTLFLLTKYVPFLYKRFPKVINSFQVSYFSEFKNIKAVSQDGYRYRPTLSEYVEKWIHAPVHIFLDFISYALSDVVTVVSNENKKEFQNTYGKVLKTEIQIIPNGVNTSDFSPAKPLLDASLLKKMDNKTVLLYVGVFRVRKRVFNLLFALKEALRTNNDILLLLVGGGRKYEKYIKDLVNNLGIEQNVILIGKVPNEEVVHYLNASDIFCLLSSYEGMPIAILEAMSCGVAILTSKVSGMIDLIDDGADGYLAKVDDIEEISAKLNSLVNDTARTLKMGSNAREKITKSYSWNSIAKNYVSLFE